MHATCRRELSEKCLEMRGEVRRATTRFGRATTVGYCHEAGSFAIPCFRILP
jgi:hypothetical protein